MRPKGLRTKPPGRLGKPEYPVTIHRGDSLLKPVGCCSAIFGCIWFMSGLNSGLPFVGNFSSFPLPRQSSAFPRKPE